MSYYVIADEDTVLGFRFGGVRGEVVEDAKGALAAFQRVCSEGEHNIIILTSEVASLIRDEVNRVRFGLQTPVVVEIPGSGGPAAGRPDLLKLIQEAVGLRL